MDRLKSLRIRLRSAINKRAAPPRRLENSLSPSSETTIVNRAGRGNKEPNSKARPWLSLMFLSDGSSGHGGLAMVRNVEANRTRAPILNAPIAAAPTFRANVRLLAVATAPTATRAQGERSGETPERTKYRPFKPDSTGQSSFLTVILLLTDLTPSVPRAMDTALSAASWVCAVPCSHTTPSVSVST